VSLGAALLAGTGAILMSRGDRDAIARGAPSVPAMAQPDITAPPGPAAALAVARRMEIPPEPAPPALGSGSDGAAHTATLEVAVSSEPVRVLARAPAPTTDRRGSVRPQPRTDRHTPTLTSPGDSHVSRSARPANIDPMDLDRGD
jgi:hypothetical protein